MSEHTPAAGALSSYSDHTAHRAFTFTAKQAALLCTLLGLGVPLLVSTLQVAPFNTVLTLVFVALIGLHQCSMAQRKLGDPNLQVLGTFWLCKLVLTLFLLYVGWIPELDPSTSNAWGYDPQRYYQDAYELIGNDWIPTSSSNYQGIVFYYAAIFYFFGHNPVIPALINAFVTLLGTLYLIRLAYEFKSERSLYDWTLAYLLLIPEVLWYDVMTSRETLATTLIVIGALAAGRYIVRSNQVSLIRTGLLTGGCIGAILAVRTTMAFPLVASIGLSASLLAERPGRRLGAMLLILFGAVALLAAGPALQQLLGGYDIDYVQALHALQSFEENVAAGQEWSDNSIGLLLAPSNAWEAVLYLPPRMILYLAAPLPNVAISISDLVAGSWSAWQRLAGILTSVINVLAFPYAIAGLVRAYKLRRENPAPLFLHCAFWVTFVAVAGGNIIIHERYRLMMTPLLFACAWLGFTTCSEPLIRRVALAWYGFLAGAAIFYLGYKVL